MRWLRFLVTAALFSIAWTKSVDRRTPEPTFDTEYGTMIGKTVGSSDVFLGVPFAKSPVDDRRFKAPQPLEKSKEKQILTKSYKPDCMQSASKAHENVDEDCLYLNIFKPSTPKSKDPLPVLVYIPGGNFQLGGCGNHIYDATNLAPDIDAIVVCVNYRVGAFGFLYYKDEEEVDILGNFGLEDQTAALMFVKKNIGNLGGNPRKITLAGQSSGAQSVAVHLTQTAAITERAASTAPSYPVERDNDLFQQAILMSGPFSISLKPEEGALKLGKKFLEKLGCEDPALQCLRNSTAEKILNASDACVTDISDLSNFANSQNFKTVLNSPDFTIIQNLLKDFGETFDAKVFHMAQPWGPTVKDQPISKFKNVDKPVMIGSLSGEANLFVPQNLPNDIQRSVVEFLFTDDGTTVYDKYQTWSKDGEELANVLTDYMFTCPAQYMAQEMNTPSVYNYYFDHGLSFVNPLAPGCDTHACHSEDLPFFFQSMNSLFTERENELLKKYSIYLANFIHNGDPNKLPDGTIIEPVYGWLSFHDFNSQNIRTMFFTTKDLDLSPELDIKKEQCKLWDKIGYYDVKRVNRK